MNIPNFLRSNLYPVLLPLLTITALAYGFQGIYWNDKTATAAAMVESYAKSGGIIANDQLCHIKETGETKVYRNWAEEPPLFHYLAVGLIHIGFEPQYFRLLPILLNLLIITGLLSLLKIFEPVDFLSALALATLPAISIHATRFIPDLLMLAFFVWALVSMFKKRLILASVLFCFAVTAKATAIFGMMGLAVGQLVSAPARDRLPTAFKWMLMGILASIPFLGWLFFLHFTQTPNPFFYDQISLTRHAGGSDFSILLTTKYWSRYFTWNAIRGCGIILFFMAVLRIRRTIVFWNKNKNYEKQLAVFALFSVIYWCLVRGTQFTGPWYSFPFLPAFAILGLLELNRYFANGRWRPLRPILITLGTVYSLSQMGITDHWVPNELSEKFHPVADLICDKRAVSFP